MRLILAIAVTAFVLAGVIVVIEKTKLDSPPMEFERPTIESIVNVHGSPEHDLKVCGQLFRRVRGGPPYYIPVSNSSSILFAYEAISGTKILVWCDTNGANFHHTSIDDLHMDDGIGSWEPTGGQMGTKAMMSLSNTFIIMHKGLTYTNTFAFDLNHDTIRTIDSRRLYGPIPFNFISNRVH